MSSETCEHTWWIIKMLKIFFFQHEKVKIKSKISLRKLKFFEIKKKQIIIFSVIFLC